jgi:hypothetical protein
MNLKAMQMFCEKVAKLLSHEKKLEEEYWQRDGFVDEAIKSMIIHLGESSDYMSTEEEFWSSSEDK